MLPDKPEGATRFLFHNVRGLKKTKDEDTLEDLVQLQQLHGIDLLGISEHHQDTTMVTRRLRLSDTVHRSAPGQAACQFDSCQESSLSGNQCGGTGITMIGSLVPKLEANGRGGDPMGRWSYVHIRRKAAPPITVFSVYQVCSGATNEIGHTAWHQQRRALDLEGRESERPRDAFIKDLTSQIKEFQTKGHEIIVGGDFNETIEEARSGILRMMTDTNLCDPWYLRNPDSPTFRTHEKGSKRIDSIFLSAGLVSSVTKLGYSPFHRFLYSDHRGLYIEFDTQQLLGQQSDALPALAYRSVNSSDKQSVTTYVEAMYDHLAANSAFDKRGALDSDQLDSSAVERMDALIGDAGQSGESHCKRRRSEWYSQELVQARFQVQILRSQLSALKRGKDRLPALQERMCSVGMDFDIPVLLPAARIALAAAEKRVVRKQSTSEKLRRAELNLRAESATNTRDSAKARILKLINKFESGRKTWQIMSKITNSQGSVQRLDRLEVPTSWPTPDTPPDTVTTLENPSTCTDWQMITEPIHIEYYLMLRNRLHFGQAQGTPFTTPPLSDHLDWEASSIFAEDVLTGEYSTAVPTAQCAHLLQECKATSELDAVSVTITLDDFAGKIKKWRESTTTSPSGRHLGRYKALFKPGRYDPNTDPEAAQAFESKQLAIAGIIISLINYCIRNNYVLRRWKSIVNTMIFKDVGEYKIHRLRVIHIYEADFNLLLAVKWRQLLSHADENGIINDGQYGGRPGCEAQSLTFLEELKYDISFVSRRTLFNFDNDAMSCYDRIIVALASLINRKYGQHRSIVAVHAKTLKEAKYKLRTAIGISDLEYSHCESFPLHGTGQGSGNSPCIWLFISSTLFDAHAKQAHGATFMTPDGKYTTRLTMVGFVDDSTGTCNDFQPQAETSLDDLINRMQHDAQVWNDLLFCSGGRLELKKCSFHVLNFTFQPDGTPVPLLDALDNRIHITDSLSGQPLPIEAKGPHDPHQTLGHLKSPLSPQKTRIPTDPSKPRPPNQLQTLVKKAKMLSTKISMSPIQRYGAFLVYHAMYVASIKYALPQSFFSKQSLDKAQKQSMGAIIAKCGLARTTPSALIFCPTEYAGGGFVWWYTLQGEGQITLFIKHWRTGTMISDVLRIDLAWHQWQAGISESILDDVMTPLTYLEGRWLPSLRDFLSHIGGKLRVDETFVAPVQRLGDFHIMSAAIDSGDFDDKDLRILNYCRLYLHVVTVSDLFNATGTQIMPHIWNCERPLWFDPQQIVTLQRRPSLHQICHRWHRLLRKWCFDDRHSGENINFGRWLHPGDQLHLRRETYMTSGPYPLLYHWSGDCYWEYHPMPSSNDFARHQSSIWTPTHASTPVDVHCLPSGFLSLLDHPSTATNPQPTPLSRDFDNYVRLLQSWEQALLANLNFVLEPHEIMATIQSMDPADALLLVSDGGSIPDVTMSFGVVLGTDRGDIFIENSGIAFGEPSSFRSEGTGQLSGLRLLLHLKKYTGLSFPDTLRIQAISDNAGLIKRDTARTQYTVVYPNATIASDWDLTEAIHSTFDDLHHGKMSYQWVKGHQDRSNSTGLTVAARYNIRADELATQAMVGHPLNPRITPLYPRTKCIFDLHGRSVHGHYVTAIRRAASEPSYFAYLENRHGWTPAIRQTIDWATFRSATRNYPTSDVHCLKLIHDKLPTKSFKAKMESWTSPNCPHCTGTPETFDHLMKCPNQVSANFRTHLDQAISTYCTDRQAPSAFSKLYRDTMAIWLEGGDPTAQHPIIGPAQQAIGWRLFPRGFLAIEWRHTLENLTHQQAISRLNQEADDRYFHDSGNSSDDSELEFFIECIDTDHTPQFTTATSDPRAFMVGLVKIVWQEMTIFWQLHLDELHAHAKSANSPDKHQELITRTRMLHQQRHLVLPEHREQYFFHDLDAKLETATTAQLTLYLRQYQPVIAASIRSASKRANTGQLLLNAVLGFTRNPRRLQLSEPSDNDLARGPSPHHKHSRWRSSVPQQRSIRDFFPAPPK